jgi:L-2-hydroxyglutarate oxidase LhgO
VLTVAGRVQIDAGQGGHRVRVQACGVDDAFRAERLELGAAPDRQQVIGSPPLDGDELESFSSERVVNAAGLDADTVAALAGVDLDAAGYRQHYCKGSYFSVRSAKAGLVSRLVYPVPGRVSLGVHAVVELDGRLKFGPDAEYLSERRLDYSVDERKRAAFGEAVRHVVPGIADDDLEPDISGIRPKLQGPGDDLRDFVIAEESRRGLPGFVNLIGIDSPGLTSAPAIAEQVAALLAA